MKAVGEEGGIEVGCDLEQGLAVMAVPGPTGPVVVMLQPWGAVQLAWLLLHKANLLHDTAMEKATKQAAAASQAQTKSGILLAPPTRKLIIPGQS